MCRVEGSIAAATELSDHSVAAPCLGPVVPARQDRIIPGRYCTPVHQVLNNRYCTPVHQVMDTRYCIHVH